MSRDKIPLYPDEDTIARQVVGPKRAREWPDKARYLEDKEGFPRIDVLMGGRFWPAVVEYFRARHGLMLPGGADPVAIGKTKISDRVRVVPFKPDGRENFDGEEASATRSGWNAGRDSKQGARFPSHQKR